MSGLMLANNTSISQLFATTAKQYDLLRKRKAYLDHFTKQPMFKDDLTEFDSSREVIQQLMDEYLAAESASYVTYGSRGAAPSAISAGDGAAAAAPPVSRYGGGAAAAAPSVSGLGRSATYGVPEASVGASASRYDAGAAAAAMHASHVGVEDARDPRMHARSGYDARSYESYPHPDGGSA